MLVIHEIKRGMKRFEPFYFFDESLSAKRKDKILKQVLHVRENSLNKMKNDANRTCSELLETCELDRFVLDQKRFVREFVF